MAKEYLKVRGEKDCATILYCGDYIHTSESVWKTTGQMNYFVSGLSITRADGGILRIKVNTKSGNRAHITGVHVMVGESDEITDGTIQANSRDDGAFWMSSSLDTSDDSQFYIREFHQEDGDNNTWDSTILSWYGHILSINLTIVGWIEKN